MKILWISDSIESTTGLGNQSFTIVRGLQAVGHEIITMAWRADVEKKHENIPIYPLYGSFQNAVSLVRKQYYAFEPDIVISYGDIHTVQSIIIDMRDSRFKDRWIHWLPVDGDPYPEKQDGLYQNIRHLVVASQFGENVFKDHYKGKLRMIYNAIDPSDYYPIPNKQSITRPKELDGKFVCLFVGMNQVRKKIDLLVEGFAKFAKDKDDVIMAMHTQASPIQASFNGWEIPHLIKKHGLDIGQKAIISTDSMTRAKLNKLYNCSDLLISATSGEGFNLPAAEAMMAGLPLLLPEFTTGKEFVGENENCCGETIKTAEYILDGPLSLRKAIVNTDDMADKLNYLYIDWKNNSLLLKEFGEIAHRRAKSMFATDVIIDQWNKTIKEVHKGNTIRQLDVVKSLRTEKKIVFIDDLDPTQWIGGTQLSTKRIIDSAKEFGYEAKCMTLENCDISDLYSANLIILNNIHETVQKSPGLISEIVSNLPYIKWEHDFNFCNTRDFKCGGNKANCQTECSTEKYVEIYHNAKSIIFQSPVHHKTFLSYFGEKVIKDYLILPPPIDPDIFIKMANTPRKTRFLWTGLMHPFRGIEEAIEYATNNPEKQFLFHSAYPPVHKKYTEQLEALPNCEVRIQPIPYEEMPQLFASCSDLFYQPRNLDASSRTCLEALLSGCRLRPNANVGLFSYSWDWSDKTKIVEEIKKAPSIFWNHIETHSPIEISNKPTHAAKVNLIFFPSGTSTGEFHLPSSHIRVYSVAEVLKKMGYNIQIVDSDLPDEMKYNVLSSLRPNDIVYVQKTYSKFNRAANFKHVKGNNVIIYDVDDYYEERNNKGDKEYMYNSDQLAMMADMVVVGSHRLAQWNSKNNKNIKVIPSLVDDSIYHYKPREVREPHQVRILWTEKDGRIYINDLMMVKDVLDELHRKYACQLILQSFLPNEIKEVQEIFPYARVLTVVNFRDYVSQRIPLMQDCDFFIAPFSKEGERHREKQYKAGQNSRHMMGLGLPGVATPTGEHDHFIEDGINGFLAKTKQEWFEKIETMITDNALRIQMGVKSRETVDRNYTIDKTIRKLLECVHTIKNKYYNPSIEITTTPQYKALVTIKYASAGGGTLTSHHIRDILENVGYKTQLLHCDKIRGSTANYVIQVDEHKLKQPMLLREYVKKYPVDVIYFDDVPRYEKDVAQMATKSYLILCGCINVHEEYYTNPVVLSGAPHVEKVFVKNYDLYRYLNALFGDKFVYWQGGIDGHKMRNRYGSAIYKHPKDGVLLTSSFSHGWWKNPTMAALAAFAVWRKYPKTKYFKPQLREQDIQFSKHSQFKILGNNEPMQRETLLETLAHSQLGLEIYLADAFPRTLLDYFSLGVPMITSNTLTFLNDYELLRENLVVSNPNDPMAIYQKAMAILEDQEKWETLSATCIEFTKMYSFQAESDVLITHSNLRIPEGKKIPKLDSSDLFFSEDFI